MLEKSTAEEKSNSDQNYTTKSLEYFFTHVYTTEDALHIIENLQTNFIELYLASEEDVSIKNEVFEAYVFLKQLKEILVNGLEKKI